MAFLTILEPRRDARVRQGPRGHESAANPTDLTPRTDREWTRVDGRVFAPRSHGLSAALTTKVGRAAGGAGVGFIVRFGWR
jgi:hypothetical protein